MGTMVQEQPARRHRMSLESVSGRMAKVDLKPLENRDFRSEIGRAIERALSIAGLTKKETAAAVGVDQAQLSRWIAGTERPQFDTLMAVDALRWPLIQALASLDERVQVVTEIRRAG